MSNLKQHKAGPSAHSDDSDCVVLVDPAKTGREFIEAVRRRGIQAVSVFTLGKEVLAGLEPDLADAILVTSVEQAQALITNAGRVRAVIPTTEPAVILGDGLADELNCLGNPVETAQARRNKIAMRRHGANHGVAVPAFQTIDAADVKALSSALQQVGVPAVLKAPASAGSFGVTLISRTPSEAESRDLLDGLGTDLFGQQIDEWLVEEYVRGREFAVNAVTTTAGHQLIDIWEYTRPDAQDYDQPYWNIVQLDPKDECREQLWSFTQRVLDTFDVRIGPSHTELKLTAQGPVLIEIASRLPGAHMTDVWRRHADLPIFDELVDLYLGEASPSAFTTINFAASAAICCIGNEVGPGRVQAIGGLAEVAAQSWVDRLYCETKVGDHVAITSGLDSVLACVVLQAPNHDTLQQRLQWVRSTIRFEVHHDENNKNCTGDDHALPQQARNERAEKDFIHPASDNECERDRGDLAA